jgi:hypothetical protein
MEASMYLVGKPWPPRCFLHGSHGGSTSDAPEAAHELADKLSKASGKPYKDRHGQGQAMENENMGITRTVFLQFCNERGLDSFTAKPL